MGKLRSQAGRSDPFKQVDIKAKSKVTRTSHDKQKHSYCRG